MASRFHSTSLMNCAALLGEKTSKDESLLTIIDGVLVDLSMVRATGSPC